MSSSARRFWLVAALALAPAAHAQDAFPAGAISFFTTDVCPAGWSAYSAAAGRAFLPLPRFGMPGAEVGVALLPGETPAHQHTLRADFISSGFAIRRFFAAPIVLSDASSRGSGAFSGKSMLSDAGIPTIRYLVCRKNSTEMVGEAPTGLIAWFERTECPAGWAQQESTQGRFLIAAPEDGVPGAAIGRIAPLEAEEDPTHTHRIDGSADLPDHQIELSGSDCNIQVRPECDGTYVRSGRNRYSGTMNAAQSGLPYIQLSACAKTGPPAPQISALVHAADYRARPVAAGQLATVFGENLGPAEPLGAELDAEGRVTTSRGGLRVFFDEFAAPLFYLAQGQINLQVPREVVGRQSGRIKIVRDDGVESGEAEYRLAPSAPAFFLIAGGQRAVAVYADGSLNSEARPAKEGDVLILFATGGGLLTPEQTTGQPAGVPLGAPALPHDVRIGGQPAMVDYLGAAPGYVGLLQLNVRMNGAKGRALVTLKIGDATSDPQAYVVAE